MRDLVPIDQLSLSERRPPGVALADTPRVRRRVRDSGFARPIPVRPGRGGRLEVLGEVGPYLAALRLGVSFVPVHVLDQLDDAEADRLISVGYACRFEDPIEEAEFYAERLEDVPPGTRPSISRLARLTGKGRSYLSRTLALLELHPAVQDHLVAGRISRTHARNLVTVRPVSRQKALAERVIRDRLSERALARLVSRGQAAAHQPPEASPSSPTASSPALVTPPSPVRTKDPDTLRLERLVSELLGCPFEIDPDAGLCTIRYFRDLDTLSGLLERLGYRE